ncbi:hypothetical protein NDU88_009410 [Pleurodeles waltl]|uniref:Uncharacterized protein n=1 Tax=Pleurodeles waltl TaxID=8319 RepID=A0AAV7QRJ9_PLEWA|nr:hypothetical protein NDU88_009410 [Pleurodeles waltl]
MLTVLDCLALGILHAHRGIRERSVLTIGDEWKRTLPVFFMTSVPRCEQPLLRNYISAIEEEEELSAEKKYRILLHCLGPDGLKIFKNINKKPRQAGDGDLYKNALEDLDNYYRPRVCIAVDRYTFFHRKQGKEEPEEDYVSALKNLAINCRFGDLHDELIHDQIVMQSSNSNIQDNLWAKGESSLQEVIDIVKRAELTGRLARMSVRLFDYNYEVQYLPGVKNTVADFLSCMPLPSNDIEEFQNTDEDGKEDMWVAIEEESICKGITRDEWNTEQNLDEVMKELSVMIRVAVKEND